MTVAAQAKKTETTKDAKKSDPDGGGKASIGKTAATSAVTDTVAVPLKELNKLKATAARMLEAEDLADEVEELKIRWLGLKDQASRAKKEYEASDERLQKRIRDKNNLLFPPVEKKASKAGEGKGGAVAPAPSPAAPAAADDNAWKSVTLEALGIDKPNVVARLGDEGITNFGQLEEWRASGRKIAGLGDAARQLIEDAVVAYWAKNPRKEAPKKDAAADKVDPATAATDLTPTIIEIKPKWDLDSGKVFDVLDLGLSEGVVAKAAHPDLADAIRRGTPDVTTLFRDPKGHRFAAAFNPTAPAEAGHFLLFRVFDKCSGKPTAKDPYYGAAFTFGDMTLYLGLLLDAVSVKDVVAKKVETAS